MPLRILEVTLGEEDRESVLELLEEAPVVQRWSYAQDNGTQVIRTLLQAADAESLTDDLVERFGSHEHFRMILLPVEATLPALEEPEEDESEEEGAQEEEPVGPRRIGREELYEDISGSSKLTFVYLSMVALSTVVAAVGLLRDDTAIVVGAMVIAPLLGPNMALSLAATLGDLDLARNSGKVIGAGIGLALLVAVGLGAVLPVDPSTPALANRTTAGLGDIFLALSAGAAGSLAFTSGVSAVLVGVMVAVALLPPLVTAGLLGGAGYFAGATGALMLVLINVSCINLAAVGTFLAQRVRPRTWWEESRAKKATRIAVASWALMLAVLVVLILLVDVGIQ